MSPNAIPSAGIASISACRNPIDVAILRRSVKELTVVCRVTVAARLAALFKQPSEKIAYLFSGSTIVIKRDVTRWNVSRRVQLTGVQMWQVSGPCRNSIAGDPSLLPQALRAWGEVGF
jgi:hypothetical protein